MSEGERELSRIVREAVERADPAWEDDRVWRKANAKNAARHAARLAFEAAARVVERIDSPVGPDDRLSFIAAAIRALAEEE